MSEEARTGGWRWRQLRRAAVLHAASQCPDDPHALAELHDMRAGAAVPTSSPWYGVRLDAVRRLALAVIADPHADAEDRWVTKNAKRALVAPHEDNARSVVWGVGGLHEEECCAQLAEIEGRLRELGVVFDYQSASYVSGKLANTEQSETTPGTAAPTAQPAAQRTASLHLVMNQDDQVSLVPSACSLVTRGYVGLGCDDHNRAVTMS